MVEQKVPKVDIAMNNMFSMYKANSFSSLFVPEYLSGN
jgi:hypothetical protein